MSSKTKRLPLAKQLERDVVHYLVKEPRFYTRVAHALDPELLTNEHARLVAELALVFYRETQGQCAMGLAIVAQRLRSLREVGRLTKEDADDTLDWLEEVWNEPHADREAVVRELARELRRHLENVAILRGMEMHGKHGSLTEVSELLAKAERLGKQEESLGSAWNDDDDENAAPIIRVERLATGITELDMFMRGGLARGEFGFAMGDSGSGKSVFLSQVAATALHTGHNPFIATLEVSERIWKSRLKAAASDIPSDLILEGELTPRDREQIKRSRSGQLAHIVQLPPKITTATDVWRAFDAANRELELKGEERRYDVLIIDYADKLGWPKECKGAYEGQDHVYETLLYGGRERNVWTWTASAAKRRDQAKKKSKDGLLRMEDVGDSIHKVRNADVILTINPSADHQYVRILLDKNRTGECGFLSEYMQTDYAFGRLVQIEVERAQPLPDSALTLPFQ